MAPSSHTHWKHFSFFNHRAVDFAPAIFSHLHISAALSLRSLVYLAALDGSVYVVDRILDVGSFIAHDVGRLTHAAVAEIPCGTAGGGAGYAVLVTLAEEDDQPPLLKFWDLDSSQAQVDEPPTMMRSLRVQHAITDAQPFPVTAFTILTTDLSLAAVAFADGRVVLIRGGNLAVDRATRQRVIFSSSPEPVTGLAFSSSAAGEITLYICTLGKIVACEILPSKETITTLEDVGCDLGCSAVASSPLEFGGNDLVVAKAEAVYFYSAEGRGPCFAFEGKKQSVFWYGPYVVIISDAPPLDKRIASSASTTQQLQITFFDPEQKYIAYSAVFPGPIVRARVAAWSGLFLITGDGKLWRLEEQDTEAKLEALRQANLYVLAIQLARRVGRDDRTVANIVRQYADHLYAKSEFDASMVQYRRTIGQLEPSYVIRKFLDAQRIQHLTSYLEDVHKRRLATAEHTSLLVNCYTKLGNAEKLERFVKFESDTANFDAEAAIRICRAAGYHQLASHIARKTFDHSTYLHIQIDDLKDYKSALEYIRGLKDVSEIHRHMQVHARGLLRQLKEETTDILIDLCTLGHPRRVKIVNKLIRSATLPVSPPTSSGRNSADPSVARGFDIFGRIAAIGRPLPRNDMDARVVTDPGGVERNIAVRFLDLPPPSAYQRAFLGDPEGLVAFLEGVAASRWQDRPLSEVDYPEDGDTLELYAKIKTEKEAVYSALLELYLADNLDGAVLQLGGGRRFRASTFDATSGLGGSVGEDAATLARAERRDKALVILQNPLVHVDKDQALILCQMAGFTDGMITIYESRKDYEQVLRVWMVRDDVESVMRALRLYGDDEPRLYSVVLNWLSWNPALLHAYPAAVQELLGTIEERKLLPPLRVLKELSRTDQVQIEAVRGYLQRAVESEAINTNKNESDVKQLRSTIEHRQKELQDFDTSARVFQNTRCSECAGALELPAVHYYCRHSYHQRCIGEEPRDCPQCEPERVRLRQQHDQAQADASHLGQKSVLARLGEAQDGWEVVVDMVAMAAPQL